MIPTLKHLQKTCDGCPAQWEGQTIDDRAVYIRYRHGWLSYGVGEDIGAAVINSDKWAKKCGDDLDGYMETAVMKIHLQGEINFNPLREPNIRQALDIAMHNGGIDGAHHKAWVIDQMVRALTGDGYEEFVAAARSGGEGPETYGWDVGIAP